MFFQSQEEMDPENESSVYNNLTQINICKKNKQNIFSVILLLNRSEWRMNLEMKKLEVMNVDNDLFRL